jgi:hypothetical protein
VVLARLVCCADRPKPKPKPEDKRLKDKMKTLPFTR